MSGARAIASVFAIVLLVGCTTVPATARSTVNSARSSPAFSFATSTPAPAVTASPVRAGPRCRTAQLAVVLGTDGVAAGTSYRQIDFRNVSKTGCTLYGYPSLVFLKKTGSVGRPAREFNVIGGPLQVVSLAPGAVGHSSLGVETAADFDPSRCRPASTTRIRITLPGQATGWVLTSASSVCSTGPASTLILPFAPGAPPTAVG